MEVFGPYLLLRPLGRGGMGVVYTARTQDSLHPLVALKRMRADADVPTFRERFEHECALALRLRHPHLLETLDAGALDGQLYVASELIRGQDLASIVFRLGEQGQGMPVAGVARVLADVLSALRYVHTAVEDDGRPLKLVHRDVTPGNVLVGYDGRAHLADFGLARSLLTDPLALTATGTILGTPRYMAPELLHGVQATPRTDLYAVGVLAYAMLTGQGPYPGGPKEVINGILDGPPTPLAALRRDVPPRFLLLVEALMAREPEGRPESAAQAALQLAEVISAEGLGAGHGALGAWLGRLFDVERARQERQYAQDLSAQLPATTTPRPVTRVLPASRRPFSGEDQLPTATPDLPDATQLAGVVPLAALEADMEPDTARDRLPDFGLYPTIVPVSAAGPRPEELDTYPGNGPLLARPAIARPPVVDAAPTRPMRAADPAPDVPARASPTLPVAPPTVAPPAPRRGPMRLAVVLAVGLLAGLTGALVARVRPEPPQVDMMALSERVGAAQARVAVLSDPERRQALEAVLAEARARVRAGEPGLAAALLDKVEAALARPGPVPALPEEHEQPR